MPDPALSVLLYGLPAIAALVFALGWISYRGMIYIRIRDPVWITESSLESGEILAEQLDYPWIRERVKSPNGYEIAVYALPGSADRVAIFHHGITWCWVGMLPYLEPFRREGWTVVALDSRGHGATGGGRPSFGFYEKTDLAAVADWALARFPHEGGYLALGLSMGASTVLQYAASEPRLDAVVADCPFSNAAAELDHRLKRSLVPFFIRPLELRIVDWFCRRNEGFSLYDANPAEAVLKTSVPIMFVHGLADDYVPWSMSVAMAERRRRRLPDAITELMLVPEARHAKSRAADPEAYTEALGAFAQKSLAAKAGRI